MRPYLIQPRDALLFRDGRPFGATGSEGARSMPFPFPSTTAGLMRTLSGQDASGKFRLELADAVKSYEVKGPLLVLHKPLLTPSSQAELPGLDWLLPAPQDALLIREANQTSCGESVRYRIQSLHPLELPPEAIVPPPTGVTHVVGSGLRILGKPQPMPLYWFWPALKTWLEQEPAGLKSPRRPNTETSVSALILGLDGKLQQSGLDALGHPGPEEESRTHVGIDSSLGTARDGALFQVRSRSFFRRGVTDGALPTSQGEHEQLGLVMTLSGHETSAPGLSSHAVTLGGERRLSYFRPLEDSVLSNGPLAGKPHGRCSDAIRQAILDRRACRLLLITPAYFEQGALPQWLLYPWEKPAAGAESDTASGGASPERASLVGACVDRPLTVSGWDLKDNRPKESRRLARAGSVYFVKLPQQWSSAQCNAWIDALWMQNVSDDAASRRDGFGLALLGVWDGIPRPMAEDAGTGSPKTPVEVRS